MSPDPLPPLTPEQLQLDLRQAVQQRDAIETLSLRIDDVNDAQDLVDGGLKARNRRRETLDA